MLRSIHFKYRPHPVGTIEMHTIEGYEDYVGYAINAKGEVYTAKNRDDEGHWTLMKKDNGLWRFSIKRKITRFEPETIKELFNQ